MLMFQHRTPELSGLGSMNLMLRSETSTLVAQGAPYRRRIQNFLYLLARVR